MIIKNLIKDISGDNLSYDIYFTRKLRTGNYSSFSPNMKTQIAEDLIDTMCEYLKNFVNHEIVQFDPSGYKDETIEEYSTEDIPNFGKVIESLTNADIVDSSLDPDKLTFYTLEINKPDDEKFEKIRIFRRVTKFKKLHSKGIIARFMGNEINRIDSKMIGIDGEVDLIVRGEKVYVISHYSLERIFDIGDAYKDMAEEFLTNDGLEDGIDNFEEFKEACLESARIRKTLTKMKNEDIDIIKTFENYENIKKTIDMFDLTLDYTENVEGVKFKLIYSDKSQINDILRIIRDSYYTSMINEEKGVDNK